RAQKKETLVVGLNGSQGSGKSTLCAYLTQALAEDAGLTSVAISLDDVYLTHAERQALAREVHPLLATRGVPGTHDLALLQSTLAALGHAGDEVAVPSFDKSIDDRRPQTDWLRVAPPVDVILLEGWCLGARHEAPEELHVALNALEADEDGDARWRSFVNEQLAVSYEPFYSLIDFWIMLAAPAFDQVLRWRTEQEEKLRLSVGGRGEGLMDDAALARFVAHFERCTRQCMRDLPGQVDLHLQLDAQRHIISAHGLDTEH
ncbi:unnamed protein product, partial [Ectocarpus sp. 12 AP-2014]